MELTVRRLLLATTLTVLAGCGSDGIGGTSATTGASAPTSTAVLPPTTVAPSNSVVTTSSSTPTTAVPSTVPVTLAPTLPPPPCAQTNGVLTTPSGRSVLLRASGVAARSPLVVVIHGYTGTPTGIERYAELTGRANSASVAVAYPQGTPVDAGGFGWATGAGVFATEGVDDVAALNEMLDVVIATGCVDPARITLTGESNGAGMALVAACDARMASRIANVVMVIPAVDAGVLARCADPARAVPLTAVAGRLDQTVPYEGGRSTLLAAEDWFTQAAATLAGCDAGPLTLDQVDAHVERRVPSGCDVCAQLLTIDDGTHTWPGTSSGTGGLRPGTFDLDGWLLARVADGVPGCLT